MSMYCAMLKVSEYKAKLLLCLIYKSLKNSINNDKRLCDLLYLLQLKKKTCKTPFLRSALMCEILSNNSHVYDNLSLE